MLVEDVVRRPLAPGLVESLVVELDGALRPVPPGVVAGWPESEAALLDLGREQVLADGPLDRRPVDLDGVELVVLESAAPFAATHVCWLTAYLDVPAAGAAGGPADPAPGAAARRCAAAEQTLDAAQALLVNADELWRHGPGALSPDLWWWRDGRLMLLPGTPASLSPPRGFVAVLDALHG